MFYHQFKLSPKDAVDECSIGKKQSDCRCWTSRKLSKIHICLSIAYIYFSEDLTAQVRGCTVSGKEIKDALNECKDVFGKCRVAEDDAVSAILSVLQAGDHFKGGILNACDGQHATRRMIVNWVSDYLGISAPKFEGIHEDKGPHRRVDNSKIKSLLGWTPKYSRFQSGYEDFLASGES